MKYAYLFSIVVLFACAENKTNNEIKTVSFHDGSKHIIIDNVEAKHKVYSPHIPNEVSFAGEKMPLHRADVREALENELVVNCFRHSKTIQIIKNFSRWSPYIFQTLEQHDVPKDFIYLAVAESEFDNTAMSHAGAMGMWQFMEATAKEYDLEINKHVDMRRNPYLAAVAASKFIKSAYSKFENWTLAAASYNCGRAGLLRVLDKQKVNSYYDLYLNKETGRYVYRIIAFKLILENPEAYGFYIPEAEKYDVHAFEEERITESIDDLSDYALEKGGNYKLLRLYNPWLSDTQSYSLPVKKGKEYILRIPKI